MVILTNKDSLCIYITDVKNVSVYHKKLEATVIRLKKIDLSNLIPGTGYNEKKTQ